MSAKRPERLVYIKLCLLKVQPNHELCGGIPEECGGEDVGLQRRRAEQTHVRGRNSATNGQTRTNEQPNK